MRRLSLVAGVALIALAFAAATRVTDTREGLVAEVITLLGGMAAVGLLIYAFTARRRSGRPQDDPTPKSSVTGGRRSLRDLAFGAGGIVLGAVLLTGLGFSGGPLWASLGLVLLLPMLAGSIYLCVRFLRSAP